MRIGIFGGSFNPIHLMHLDIARTVIQKKYVDKVIFVPTSTNYVKTDLLPNKTRYNMIQLVLEDNMEVSDFEFQPKLVYTYQTLDHFQKEYPNDEIVLIIGEDNYSYLDEWKRSTYILDTYSILVIHRPGEYSREIKGKIQFAEMKESPISSSQIRHKIALKDPLVKQYLDQKVYEYIEKNNLYQ